MIFSLLVLDCSAKVVASLTFSMNLGLEGSRGATWALIRETVPSSGVDGLESGCACG